MADPNRQTQALFIAIQKSDLAQVKALLASDVELNHKNKDGQTALTLASSLGNPEIIQALVSAGAAVNVEPEPLVINPTITSSQIPGEWSLGDLIEQATAGAPDDAKEFYAGFMSFVDALSGEKESPSEVGDRSEESDTQEFQSNESDSYDDEEDYEDDDYADENDDEYEYEPKNPLDAAVLAGDITTVQTLLEAGAEPNPSTWYDAPPLLMAVDKGHADIAQALIDAGANVNRGFDELPLHTAAKKGHLDIVRLLLDLGADVEAYEEDYWTALMGASLAGHLLIVQLLVARGADVNAWSQGETPLMLAARGAHRDVYDFLYPLVSDKIRAIGDRDSEKEMARTLREQARKANKGVEKLVDAAIDGNLKRIQQLIAEGVGVNSVSSCNRTALSLAIQGGQISIIKALLDAGADPNLPDEDDDGLAANSPLMEAASTFFAGNCIDMVRLLVERGANLNQQNAKGCTALMCAADSNIVQALIQAGADLDVRDNEGNTALMRAIAMRRHKIVDVLQKAGASQKGLDEVALLKAVRDGDTHRVRTLLQNDMDVNLRVGETTALCEAAQEGHHEIAKLLIAAGADVDRRAHDGYFNPLLNAAYAGHLEVVKVLLEAGADVHVRVEDFLNPLEYAELAKAEGNPHTRDKPLDEVIALLESYGATRSDVD